MIYNNMCNVDNQLIQSKNHQLLIINLIIRSIQIISAKTLLE